MRAPELSTTEKTYRAIGRFMFEFSQVEYTIRHHLAEAIELRDDHFHAVASPTVKVSTRPSERGSAITTPAPWRPKAGPASLT
jgi:hypothetical protein